MIGHNPKANQHSENFRADDCQDVAALLRELPRVAAPTDFNASLKARIATAKAADNEFAGVTALVKGLPRVVAPADFDFKLRARIAQAKAEQQKSSAGWFAEWFGRTFSWMQASAALAAVAMVVSVVSFGVLRSDNIEDSTASTTIAKAADLVQSVVPTDLTQASPEPRPKTIQSPATDSLSNVSVKTRTIKYAPRPTTSMITTGERKVIGVETPVPSTLVATKVMIKHQSGQSRMVNLSEYNLGLQTAHLRSTPATPRSVETAMANIY